MIERLFNKKSKETEKQKITKLLSEMCEYVVNTDNNTKKSIYINITLFVGPLRNLSEIWVWDGGRCLMNESIDFESYKNLNKQWEKAKKLYEVSIGVL